MNRIKQNAKYIFFDIISAELAWFIFYIYRRIILEKLHFDFKIFIEVYPNFIKGLLVMPLFWLVIYFISGYYKEPFRKARLIEIAQTFNSVLVGSIIIFFTFVLNDHVESYKQFYYSFFTLLALQFTLTYIPRLIITTITTHRIKKGIIGFSTLLVGAKENALKVYNDMTSGIETYGNKFVGFISSNGSYNEKLAQKIPFLGYFENIEQVIKTHKVEEIIIATEFEESKHTEIVLTVLQKVDAIVKAIPSIYDIITGPVRLSSFLGVPLIVVSHQGIPAWQEVVKRIFDILVSISALFFGFPIFIFAAIGVKISSKGPIFYNQERIGLKGKIFKIYKFRSMFVDAEQNGPLLSSLFDKRITNFGNFMRKTRLDEIPQFYNVLIGDMSFVGPRPERQFYIDQIVKTAPHFYRLLKVKPGITSWGQVKYGYAENVEQMIERLNYDILYVENMSLYYDFKIIIYTIMIVLKRKGK